MNAISLLCFLLVFAMTARAEEKTFSAQGKGALLQLAVGESGVSRNSSISSTNDISSTVTLRKLGAAEAEITFSHSDHCLNGKPQCVDGHITKAKDVTLRVGRPQLVVVLWTSYTFTLKSVEGGRAALEVLIPSAKIRSKAQQKAGAVAVSGEAAGVSSVEVSITSGARGTDYGQSVTAEVRDGHWSAPMAGVPPGHYSVMISSGDKQASLTQGKLAVR
ncbi:MAG: hypothetical protein ACXVB9_09770 [Bdellovibrionota bacterium]